MSQWKQAIVLLEGDGSIRFWGADAQEIFGYEPDEVEGGPLSDLVVPDDRPILTEELKRVLGSGDRVAGSPPLRLSGLTRDATRLPIAVGLHAWPADEAPIHLMVVMDLSGLEEKHRRARAHEVAMATLEEGILLATGDLDRDGPTIAFANASMAALLRASPEGLVGRSVSEVIPEDLYRRVGKSVQRRLAAGGEEVSDTVSVARENGDALLLRWTVIPVRTPDGVLTHLVAVVRDVTEARRVEETGRRLDHDPATGLPDQGHFLRRLGRAVRWARRGQDYRFAMLLIEPDEMEGLREGLGEEAGDRVLMAMGWRLRTCLRMSDLVARFGDGRLAVLLDHSGEPGEVGCVLDRVRSTLAAPYVLVERSMSVTASIGVAFSKTGYEVPEAVVRDAEIALERAVAAGGDRHEVFDRRLYSESLERHRLLEDLRSALAAGRLRLHYQPLVSMESGRVLALEGLLRWVHPELGALGPASFLHVAEESPLAGPIGEETLRQATEMAGRLRDALPSNGLPAIHVNLWAGELQEPRAARRIEDLLRDTGLRPDRIVFELSGQDLARVSARAPAVLPELKEMGLRMWLDRFGLGGLSLPLLAELPVERVKIPLQTLGWSERLRGRETRLVGDLLSLVRDLRLEAAAVGVETPSQRDALQAAGCDVGQGYLFSEPLEADAAVTLVREAHRPS